MTVNGRDYPIRGMATQVFQSGGIREEVGTAGAGAGVGGVIGGLLGGVKGAVLGAVIGAGGAIAATDGKDVSCQPGPIVRMRLDSTVNVRASATEGPGLRAPGMPELESLFRKAERQVVSAVDTGASSCVGENRGRIGLHVWLLCVGGRRSSLRKRALDERRWFDGAHASPLRGGGTADRSSPESWRSGSSRVAARSPAPPCARTSAPRGSSTCRGRGCVPAPSARCPSRCRCRCTSWCRSSCSGRCRPAAASDRTRRCRSHTRRLTRSSCPCSRRSPGTAAARRSRALSDRRRPHYARPRASRTSWLRRGTRTR